MPSQQRCSACDEIAGQVLAPGGVIHSNGLWFVSHHTGPYTDPGELIVKTRRHCESLAELTGEEADALGPVLHRAVRALERVVAAERIYAVSFNERVRHVHFLSPSAHRRYAPGPRHFGSLPESAQPAAQCPRASESHSRRAGRCRRASSG